MKWLAVSAVATAYVVLGIIAFVNGAPEGCDTAVYQAGASALLHGDPLYDADVLPREPGFAQLPFTYPPTATLMFIPLVMVPPQVAWGLLNAITVLALMAVTWITLKRVPRRPAWLTPGWASILLGIALLAIEPVRMTLGYGQINVILMALALVDVLVLGSAKGRARHFSGVLIGIAAAVKLTPLIFVGHLLLTGRRADAARAFGTFLALQGFMLAIAWHDTVRYWTHTIKDPSRIGPTDGMWNQSLGGMVRRLSELAPWSQQVAFLIGALLAIPAALLVRRFHKRERPVHALLVSAFTGLLLSPVSWLHHWVWVAPLLVLLIAEAGCGNWLAKWLVPATVFVFVIPVPRILIHFTTRLWDGILITAGNSYVLFPVLVGAALLLEYYRRVRRRAEAAAQVG